MMTSKIDNPGGGDCGFYAFSIGLIDIIQKEHQATGSSPTFQRWKHAANEIILENILKINLHELRQTPRKYKDNLFPLQHALRKIVAKSTKEDLHNRIREDFLVDNSTRVEGSTVYGKFMALVKASLAGEKISSHYNELALSPQVKALAEQTATDLRPELEDKPFAEQQKIENDHVKQVLTQDVMQLNQQLNPDSIILKGIDQVKQQGRWATHDDLKEIAAVLEVNLWVEGKNNGSIEAEQPTVTLNNHSNRHWTTMVELPPEPTPVKSPAKTAKNSSTASKVPSEDIKGSYSLIEQQLKLSDSEKEFVAYQSSGSENAVDSFKIELAKLVKMRQSPEHQQKLKVIESKQADTLSDEELALKLQEEEFRNPSLKP